jgi:hypothetical protein
MLLDDLYASLITRVRINQMEEDGFYRKQIQKRM